MNSRTLFSRVVFSVCAALLGAAFALPLIWFVLAPFNAQADLDLALPKPPTLANFSRVFANQAAVGALLNSLLQAFGTVLLVATTATLAAYALARTRLRGKRVIEYVLLLFSSVVSGSAAMVPIFLIVNALGLIDTQLAVILVFAGGLLPTAMFILRDFIASIPRGYEESALVAGASPWRAFVDVVVPVLRPGVTIAAVWAFVQVWGGFLIPFVLLRSEQRMPASVEIYSFYSQAGTPIVPLLAAYSVLYSLPVIALYWYVNRKYGFRFFGGIKS